MSKITKKTAMIGVVGLGQVGLPTALSFVRGGFSVIGFDSNSQLINSLSRGITTIPEEGIRNLLVSAISKRRITFESSGQSLLKADVIIVCVPTPLGQNFRADLGHLYEAVTEVGSRCIHSRKLVIIESSIPPMTMRSVIVPTLEKVCGSRLGNGFLLAFCPERLSPGQAMAEISGGARLIGASDDASFEAAKTLYSSLTCSEIIKTNFETAEVSKLAENAFRDVNIAFANELTMICQNHDVDIMEVIKIANTHPRVSILNPGAGVGGPCLPKDPYLLLHNSHFSSSVILNARSINDGMPAKVVEFLLDKIGRAKVVTKDKLKIGILGLSYKPNVNDSQNSPARGIISELRRKGLRSITLHDPICKDTFGMRSSSDLKTMLKDMNIVIITIGHDIYASLSPSDFRQSCIIVDVARVLRKGDFMASGRIQYTAPGLSM